MKTLIKTISEKKVLWFESTNQYVLTDTLEADILLRISNGEKLSALMDWCQKELMFSADQATDFVNSIQDLLNQQSKFVANEIRDKKEVSSSPKNEFHISRYYKIQDKVFWVEYQTAELEFQIHPKFAHLEINPLENYSVHFQICFYKNEYVLSIDDKVIGSWDASNFHYLTGKFSMELLNHFYHKTENDWLAVLHASAVGKGEDCILFAGDSGSGKSTSSAVLMSDGFQLIADDFVPLDKEGNIRFFPAALSVKKSALNVLSEKFPELNNSQQIHYKHLNKTIKYLVPEDELSTNSYSAKAIIFIKYEEGASLELVKIDNADAFKELIPDTWTSKVPDNVNCFLDWFSQMPCYSLKYSDNLQLITEVNKLFKHGC